MANQHTKRAAKAKTDAHRDKIRTTQLINRLMSHIEGKTEMTATQVTAAKALLNKVLPDLQAATIDATVETNYVARMPEMPKTAAEWQKQFMPTIQ